MSDDFNQRAISKHPQYLIDDLGGIYSLKSNKFLKPWKDTKGYLQVRLDGKYYMVHRLILDAFVGPSSDKQCNHLNGIKTDNRLKNLKWVTGSENCKHAHQIGLRNISGEGNPNSKLNKSLIQEFEDLRIKGYTYQEIGLIYNLNRSTISRAINRRTYNGI